MLPPSFFDRHHLDLARDLLGTTLVWDGVAGTIVETEAYGAEGDPACHTFFRKSARTFFDSHPPGTVYAYINYGIHWLLNILAADGIILIRALEPTRGIARMVRRRNKERLTDLCSGPGKLGAALALGRPDHGTSLAGHLPRRGLLPRPPDLPPPTVVADVRIGISKATDYPWRFLIEGNPHVSVPPRLGRRHPQKKSGTPRGRSRQGTA
ncbi:DNA-3-methyladenine glycosylase [soil metagenome]